jgi:hypothetical protein
VFVIIFLTTATYNQTPLFIEELGESKRVIEKKLDKPCPCPRWPVGKFREFATGIARDVGY